jgi:hypothetical protein
MKKTEILEVEQLVLVYDPIMGSRYEIQLVKVEVENEEPTDR